MGATIGINPDWDYLFDPQQATAYGFCSDCGAEIYDPFQELCDRCQRDTEAEQD